MKNAIKKYNAIKEMLPENLRGMLRKDAAFWAPEIFEDNLNVWCQKHVPLRISDEMSVRVHACLNGCSALRLKARIWWTNRFRKSPVF